MVSYPRVSIIILNWNGLEESVECLQSLKKITYPNYEVIVVDNGSEGNDVEVLHEKFGIYIHIIKNDKNCGFGGGSNIGMKYVLNNLSSDYILLLNNDTVVDSDFLTEMVEVAESDRSIGIVGSKIYFCDDPNRFQLVWIKMDMWKVRGTHVGAREMDRGQYDEIKEVDCAPGTCLLVKREVIDSIGLLDESYFYYQDDLDYCFRARTAGYRIVYAPKAKIWHRPGQTAEKVPGLKNYYIARNTFKFMRKYANRRQYCYFWLYFFGFHFWFVTGVCLIYHRGDVRSLLAFYRGVRDGLWPT